MAIFSSFLARRAFRAIGSRGRGILATLGTRDRFVAAREAAFYYGSVGLLNLDIVVNAVVNLMFNIIRDLVRQLITGDDEESISKRYFVTRRAQSLAIQILSNELAIALVALVPKRTGRLRLGFRVQNAYRRIRVTNTTRYEENVWFLYPRLGEFTWRRVARRLMYRIAPGAARRAVYLSL